MDKSHIKITGQGMRRFRIDRYEDPTGVSGTGCVAQGCVFHDGVVVIRWMGDTPTTTIHTNIESVEQILLHGGGSQLRWEDPICYRCGAHLLHDEWVAKQCFACGTGQGDELCFETRIPG